MRPLMRPVRLLQAAVLLAATIFSLSTCGGIDGTQVSGGGTGGTGISTGSVTGFGSVVMNGTEYKTSAKTKKLARGVDKTGQPDPDVFRVGMVVTVHHSPGDNNAVEIDYEPNLVGPISAKDNTSDPTIRILGHSVLVDNAALFSLLDQDNVVEVSGFADNTGRILGTFVYVLRQAPIVGDLFEIRGFISGLRPSDRTFGIGPLPDNSAVAATVSYTPAAILAFPSGLADGMYVEVRTKDTQPGFDGIIKADSVTLSASRTAFPEGATVTLDGLVTRINNRSGNILSAEVEGKAIRTDGSTVYLGGTAADIQPNARVLVRGTERSGVLSAAEILIR